LKYKVKSNVHEAEAIQSRVQGGDLADYEIWKVRIAAV
jgi:hypothetical protein